MDESKVLETGPDNHGLIVGNFPTEADIKFYCLETDKSMPRVVKQSLLSRLEPAIVAIHTRFATE